MDRYDAACKDLGRASPRGVAACRPDEWLLIEAWDES
jgi:hypothetical protein